MDQWIHFFVGTPRRLLSTVALGVFIFALLQPEAVGNALNRLLYQLLLAVGPLEGPLLQLGLVGLGLWLMVRPLFRKKGKKK